jgi:hypothetical protein
MHMIAIQIKLYLKFGMNQNKYVEVTRPLSRENLHQKDQCHGADLLVLKLPSMQTRTANSDHRLAPPPNQESALMIGCCCLTHM